MTKSKVRKMLWLRAYARKLRWDEELIIVPFEMDCTVRKFRGKAADWNAWGQTPRSAGHKSYACKQQELWTELAEHAQNMFTTVTARVLPVLST